METIRRPLVLWTLFYLAGCYLGAGWQPAPWVPAGLAAAWCAIALRRRCSRCAAVVWLCLGTVAASHASASQVDIYHNGQQATLTGVVSEPPHRGSVLLRVGGQRLLLHAPALGWRDIVRCAGELQAVDGPRNPGDPDERHPGVWHVLRASRIEVVGRDDRWPWGLCRRARTWCETGIARLWPDDRDGDLMRGLLLGDQQRLEPALGRLLTRTGTLHLLGASGLKVAAVGLLLQALLSVTTLSIRGRTLLTAIAVIVYAGMCGASWPVLRASGMVLIALWAEWTGHAYDGVNALAAMALVLAGLDPLAPADPGFYLSFGIMAGLFLSRPVLEASCSAIPPAWRRVVTLTVGVQLALAPWQAMTRHELAGGQILANLVVVLPAELLIVAAMPLSLLASLGLPWTGGAALVRLALTLGLTILSWMPAWPIPLLGVPPGALRAPGWLEVTFLDVDQGDAAVVRLPDGSSMLVDAGPVEARSGSDAGERVVAPFLLRQGVSHLVLAAISHPHLDHYGGLPAISQLVPVDAVAECGLPGQGPEWAAFRQHFPTPMRWRAGDRYRLDCGVRIDVFHPGPVLSTAPNNASLVFKLRWGRISILFAGDAEKEAETEMLARDGQSLGSTVLKVPHHGSATSSTAEFLAAVHPAVAIISVGRHNHLGLPHPTTVARLAAMVPRVLRTDRDGGVVLTTDGEHLWVQPTMATEGGAARAP